MSITMLPTAEDDQRHVRGTSKPHKMRENPYNNNVLVGNWFEERFADKSDKKAITPCIYGQSSCLQEKPLYQRDFPQPIANESCKDHRPQEYIQWKQKGFSNRLNGEATNIKLWDGELYERNITTTKDLMFRILPEQQKTSGASVGDGKRMHSSEDLMRSYGNSTQTGLLQWRSCEERKERNTPIDMSHYKNAFKRIPLPTKRSICKASMRKTSIV